MYIKIYRDNTFSSPCIHKYFHFFFFYETTACRYSRHYYYEVFVFIYHVRPRQHVIIIAYKQTGTSIGTAQMIKYLKKKMYKIQQKKPYITCMKYRTTCTQCARTSRVESLYRYYTNTSYDVLKCLSPPLLKNTEYNLYTRCR